MRAKPQLYVVGWIAGAITAESLLSTYVIDMVKHKSFSISRLDRNCKKKLVI